MKGQKMFDALSKIDDGILDRLIGQAQVTTTAPAKRRSGRVIFVALAACFLLPAAILSAVAARRAQPPVETAEPERDADITDSLETVAGEPITETDRIQFVYERETFEYIDAIPAPTNLNACVVQYFFYSIRDLETYLMTGSENYKDYSKAPSPGFPFGTLWSEKYGTRTKAEYFRTKYCSLETAFGIDADQIDSFNGARFTFMKNGDVFFFDFDDVVITTICAPQYCAEHTARDYIPALISWNDQFDPSTLEMGSYVRNCGDTNVVYRIQSTGSRSITLIAENFIITVSSDFDTSTSSIDLAQSQKIYERFLSTPEFAPLAELFSADDAVFEARVNSIIQNISNRYSD